MCYVTSVKRNRFLSESQREEAFLRTLNPHGWFYGAIRRDRRAQKGLKIRFDEFADSLERSVSWPVDNLFGKQSRENIRQLGQKDSLDDTISIIVCAFERLLREMQLNRSVVTG